MSEEQTQAPLEDDAALSESLVVSDPPTGEYGVSPKIPKHISLSAFLLSSVSLVLVAVMLTLTLCNGFYRQKLAELRHETVLGGNVSVPVRNADDSLALFAALFDYYAISAENEINGQAVIDAALKEYVRQTGDPYAAYYTAEEFAALQKDSVGQTQGIGVSIIESTVSVNGTEFTAIKIINVMKNSPAMEAGVKVNDRIVYVGGGEDRRAVSTLGYDPAVKALQGTAGTTAEFTVWREDGNGGYEEKAFSILRREFTGWSVSAHVCTVEGYENVGIVKIMQFDLTTPPQFCEAMDSLLTQGCTKFVFDVRYNPGGDLASIKAVLSYLLQEGDTIIRTRDKSEIEEKAVVGVIQEYPAGSAYASCNVSKEDIGKYRGYELAVLCNGNTASAAELFTAALRDYELATVVGTTTYGKGSMQTIHNLAPFGCQGALKMTTALYFPPLGESYDGIGITPHVTVALSEEASKINIYEIKDSEDNQLTEALKQFQP